MQRILPGIVMVLTAWLATGCKKKSAQAVVEEVPAASATKDTATALKDEPSLEQVGGKLKGTAPSTFHTDKTSEGEFSASGKYVVQVAVYKSARQARHLIEKLKSDGYPAYTADVESPTPDLSGTYHRVRIGNFPSLKAAHDFGENTLKGKGFQYWIDKKKNDHVAMESSGSEFTHSSPSRASNPVSEPSPSAASSSSTESHSTPPEPAPSSFTSSPTPNPTPKSSATPTEPSQPSAEPVGVPEPPAPNSSEPPPASQDNSWGNPLSDTAKPAKSQAPGDSGKPVEGW